MPYRNALIIIKYSFCKKGVKSIVAASLLAIVSSCAFVEQTPTTPPANPQNVPVVRSNTQTTHPSQPKLTVATTKDDKEKIKKALLHGEAKPLTTKDVGYYMDVLYANLQQKLSGDTATMSRQANAIHIVLPGSLAFASGQASIKPSVGQTLSVVADVLGIYTKTIVEVEGHTDNQGNPAYNQQLSERRALAVGQYLADHNIAENRLLIMGFGASKPISSNETATGQAQNRRVELILTPVVAD